MMSKYTAQGKMQQQDKKFKLQIYQRKGKGQINHGYDQGNYWTRNRSNSDDR